MNQQQEVQHEQRTYRGIAYVNVYAVTRHYGGPEEGGWYYNRGEPLASIPVPATFTEDHDYDEDGFCDACLDEVGCARALCRNTKWDADDNAVEWATLYLQAAFAHEKHGNIYSVLGGTDVQIITEPHMAASWPARTPHYE